MESVELCWMGFPCCAEFGPLALKVADTGEAGRRRHIGSTKPWIRGVNSEWHLAREMGQELPVGTRRLHQGSGFSTTTTKPRLSHSHSFLKTPPNTGRKHHLTADTATSRPPKSSKTSSSSSTSSPTHSLAQVLRADVVEILSTRDVMAVLSSCKTLRDDAELAKSVRFDGIRDRSAKRGLQRPSRTGPGTCKSVRRDSSLIRGVNLPP